MSHGSPSSLTVFLFIIIILNAFSYIFLTSQPFCLSSMFTPLCHPSSFSNPSFILLYLLFPSWSLQTDSQVGLGLVSALHFLSAVSVSRLSGPADPRTVPKKEKEGKKELKHKRPLTRCAAAAAAAEMWCSIYMQGQAGQMLRCVEVEAQGHPPSGRVGIMLECLTCSHSSRRSLKVCTRNAFINFHGRYQWCTDSSFGFAASRWQKVFGTRLGRTDVLCACTSLMLFVDRSCTFYMNYYIL